MSDECRGNLFLGVQGVEKVVRLTDGQLLIGRGHGCDVVVEDPKVSRAHLRLEVSEDTISLYDLESASGTQVNGVPVSQATLAGTSTVQIGDTELRIELVKPAPQQASGTDYIEVKSGINEPSIVETLLPGEVTLSHDGVQQAFQDLSLPRVVVFGSQSTAEYSLTKERMIIGRDKNCDIVLQDSAASREHACLELKGGRVMLRDLDSKNGTFLRASPVSEIALFSGVNFRIGSTFLVYKAGVQAEGPGAVRRTERSNRRPVVVLPGIMGSELYLGDKLFWPNLTQALRNPALLSVGHGETLRLGRIAKRIIVIPNFIKLDAYSELVDYLEDELGYVSGQDLLEFPYDWRQDNRDSAEKLKAAVDRWRKEVIGMDTKFTILCHSMGALVSRYYLNCLGGDSHVDKFVALAGAHFGAPFVIQGLLYGPDLLPLGIGQKNFHLALTSMPSAYQLIPPYPAAFGPDGKSIDLHEDNSWVKPEHRHLLKSAAEFHKEIGQTTKVPTTCIFGYGVKTVTRVVVNKRSESGWDEVRFMVEPAGDNRVVDRYGYLEGADIHPVKQHHGSLWNDKDVKMRIKLELLDELPDS